MIQPVSTLREHPRVFKLPTPDDEQEAPGQILDNEEPSSLEEASDNYRATVENRRINNLDDYLMDDPDKPERDNKMIQKNRDMSKKAALIQVLDGIGDVAHLNRNQENATVSPSRYGDMGLTALNNIHDIDREFKADLNRYNQRKEEIGDFNRRQKLAVQGQNQELDETLAKQDYEQFLNKATAEKLAEDEESERYYEAGLRSISNRDFTAADFYLERAGLDASEIQRIKGSARDDSGGGSGEGVADGIEITPKQEALYEEYRHYDNLASDDDYRKVGPDMHVKPGSPSYHRDKLMESMGEDFYMIDYKKRPERERAEHERITEEQKRRSEQLESDPRIQDGVRDSEATMQRTLANQVMTAPNFQDKQSAAAEWLSRNRQKLIEEGLEGEELDTVNEEMFLAMLNEERGRNSGGEEVTPEATESRDVNIAGGSNRESSDEAEDIPSTDRELIEGAGDFRETTSEPPTVDIPENRREALPRHLKGIYDLADKYLEQKHRMDMIKERNSSFDTSFGDKQTEQLLERLRQQADRIPRDEDRQKLIEALPFNPFE